MSKVESKIRVATYTPPPVRRQAHHPSRRRVPSGARPLPAAPCARTERLQLRVKATRGVVTLQGKVRTEALRQRAENIARSTLGLRELAQLAFHRRLNFQPRFLEVEFVLDLVQDVVADLAFAAQIDQARGAGLAIIEAVQAPHAEA